ncbi:MAG: hypothetical protein ABJA67_04245 [Chthonomonadales bacterium]
MMFEHATADWLNSWRTIGCMALFLGLPWRLQSRVPITDERHQHQSANERGSRTRKTLLNDVPSHRISMERYRFARRLERKLGTFPLWQSFDVGCKLMFPTRRSDRAYVLVRGANHLSIKGSDIALFCYQHKGKRDILVYRVNLKYGPTRPTLQVNNLLDYLNSFPFAVDVTNKRGKEISNSYSVTNRESIIAHQDLIVHRNYAIYDYLPVTDSLRIFLSIDIKNNRFPDEDRIDFYGLSSNPITGNKMKPSEFYKQFGLPMAKGE